MKTSEWIGVGFAVAFTAILVVIVWSNFSFALPVAPPEFFQQTAPLEHFEVLAEVSMVVNLTFTALISFGKLAGMMVRWWADKEELRVSLLLDENPDFHRETFVEDIEIIVKDALRLVGQANTVVYVGALAAIAAAAVFSAFAAFFPAEEARNNQLLLFFALIFLPVPLGFILHVVVRVVAWIKMRIKSNGCTALIRYTTKKSATRIAEVEAEMKKLRKRDP